MLITCEQCKKDFEHLKLEHYYSRKRFCKDCILKRKKKHNYRVTERLISGYCPVCKDAMHKTGMIAHGWCKRKLELGNYQIDREYCREHINGGILDEQPSEFI